MKLGFYIVVRFFFIVLVLHTAILSCKSKISKSAEQKVYQNQILPEKIKLNINADWSHGRVVSYREEINKHFSNYYLNYLSDTKELIFFPLFVNTPVFTISVEKFSDNNFSRLFIVVKDSTAYLYNKNRSLIYSLHFGGDFKINKVDSLNKYQQGSYRFLFQVFMCR